MAKFGPHGAPPRRHLALHPGVHLLIPMHFGRDAPKLAQRLDARQPLAEIPGPAGCLALSRTYHFVS